MNLIHRWYCRSGRWAAHVRESVMPDVVEGLELGREVLELGPGPGLTTDWLRERVPHLTAIEIDTRLATRLRERLAGTSVTVVEGDATAMPFPDGSFDSVLCMTMLHHVPSPELQDRMLAEACRVLRPGGVFAGRDSTLSWLWRLYHLFDTCTVVAPAGFPARLERAGFTDIHVDQGESGFRFRARKPGG